MNIFKVIDTKAYKKKQCTLKDCIAAETTALPNDVISRTVAGSL